jgi:hypothetical protein
MQSVEIEMLAAAIRRDFPTATPRVTDVDRAPPAVRVIDCVLSLNRRYDTVVEPRVLRFLQTFPQVQSCGDLIRELESEGPAEFFVRRLDMRFPARAEVLIGVARKMDEIQRATPGDTELSRIEEWARAAVPHDYARFGVKGFGIAGFQYLRLLFGANTTKPDTHIVRYVSRILSRPVNELDAIALLEHASQSAGCSMRAWDSAIWEYGAGHR